MKFWQVVVLIVLLAAIGVGIAIWQPWKISARKIEVSATGKTQAVPDVSKITAGVEIQKSTADAAQTEATAKLAAIVAAVKQQGIADKDIQTENVSTYPDYDYENGSRIKGYYGRGVVTITVRDITKAQDIVSTATTAGASSVYGPQLTFSDEKLEQAQAEAREEAVKNAKTKAESLAQASGAKLGKVLAIQETPGYSQVYPMFAAESAGDLRASGAGQSSIEPGENDITIEVTVSYALK